MTSISESRWRPAPTRRGVLPGLAAHLDPAPLPRNPRPMLCTLVAKPFNDDRWLFEPKYDGLRVLGVFDGEKLTLLSRNEQAQNFQFPDIVAALQANLRYPAVVDGEVVCFDGEGRTSFRILQQRFHLKDAGEVQQRMQEYPAFLYLFDILYVDRYDATSLPLERRKELLREAVDWSEHVRWTPFQDGDMGIKLFRQACRDHEEGIVGKLRTSRYVGGRSDAWVKIKCLSKQEFVIAGFTDPQRSRVGLGALLVGYYSDDGKQFIYAGKVGTGFTHETLLDLRQRLDPLVQRISPFTRGGAPHGENVHWVKPRLVAEIAFSEWTQHGLLRQPRFEGLRTDKKPTECHRERPRRTPRNHIQTNHQTPVAPRKRVSAMVLENHQVKRDSRVNNGVFAFTNTEKVMFPDNGITKGDVLSFYNRIAPRLLPFLRDRPVTVERLPDGLARPDSPRFWQKNTPDYYPSWIPRVELHTERGKPVHYALVNNIQALLYMVNQGALTFHTWLSRVENLDRPDFVLFDLDPGQARFANVVTIALALRKILKGEVERAFVKTSGKTGLHVLVPWTQAGGYDEARAWALERANRVAEEYPQNATTEIRKVKRGSRVYIDTLQNARGHHAVPPYVLRAIPAATVSTPLEWNELTPTLDLGRFTITTIFRRLARQKKDPLAPLLRSFKSEPKV